jgi:dihydrofolate reductase
MKVSLLMAQTLDGRIAKDANHFPDWTESADKKFFRSRTKEAGVMIFGRTTFETLPGVLPGRLSVVMSRSAGEWEAREENLVFTSLSPKEILKKLKSLGFQNTIVAGGTTINSLFARENLIDQVIVTLSPLVFGQGLGVFDETVEMNLQLEKFEKIGETTLALWYSVHK